MTLSGAVRHTFLLGGIILVSLQAGCATGAVSPLSAEQLAEKFGFLRVGETTKATVFELLGQPQVQYERDRAVIYFVFENDAGQLGIQWAPPREVREAFTGKPMIVMSQRAKYDLVLFFDERDVLIKRSIVHRE